ncbi:unnamed protein product [Cochlearia groenlandica]
MGACVSSEPLRTETTKLILQDGTLQEFSSPVKAWQILQKNPTSFICNSDSMDFDDAVSALSGNEDLVPGELYFVLPMTWLNQPLKAEQMASLAVKASYAMTKNGGSGGVWINRGGEDEERNVSGGKGRRRKFTAELSLIAE